MPGNYLNINDKTVLPKKLFCWYKETVNTKTTPRADRNPGIA